jgi:hypothetical protein
MAIFRYVKTWLILTLTLLVCLPTLNLVMDPLDAYRVVYIDGFNTVKSKMKRFIRLSKAVQIQRRQPEILLMGSSRSEFGYPMNRPEWSDKSVYNYAVSGANVYTVYRFFQHAVSQSKVKRLILGVDFFMFNTYVVTPFPEEPILAVEANGDDNHDFKIKQALNLLFSIDVLNASFGMLGKQEAQLQRYTQYGRLQPSVRKKRRSQPILQKFESTELSYALNAWTPCHDTQFAYQRADGAQNTFGYLQKILALAKANDIEVTLIISPSHARLWELLDLVGLWPEYEHWKQLMVDMVSEYSEPSVTLWDFSGYHHYAIEPVPDKLGEAMKWYLDTSHFSAALGQKVLDQVVAGENGAGVVLTKQNLNAHLSFIKQAQLDYRKNNLPQYQSLKALADKYRIRRQARGIQCDG